MCAWVHVTANPLRRHRAVSVSENNKYEEGGETRGCDHQSIPLAVLQMMREELGGVSWDGEIAVRM